MKNSRALLSLVLLLAGCSQPQVGCEPDKHPSEPELKLVEMKLEAQRHVGLQVEPARVEQLNEYLEVTGTIQPIDSRIGEVRPLSRGRVEEVLARVGDRVRKGQPLVRFDSIEAGELLAQHNAAQAELERFRVQYTAATRQAERKRSLAEIGAVPQKEVELSQADQQALGESMNAQKSVIAGLHARLERFGVAVDKAAITATLSTTINSPFSGVVIGARSSPGEVVEANTPLFSVADLSEVWVQAEVYEKDLGRVRVGQTAFVSVDTYPNEKFSGKVTYVSDVLDPKTRTVKVRCELANPDLRLKLDMFATVSVPTTFSRQAIAVSAGAVQQIGGRDVVFVRKTPAQFEVRTIKTGKTVGGRTEISEGLSAGEEVVSQGSFHLKSIVLGKELGEGEK